MAVRSDITVETVRQFLEFNHEHGFARWRKLRTEDGHSHFKTKRWNRRWAGRIAGCQAEGYITIRIEGVAIQAHILAWADYHGEWPDKDIDHRDQNGLNNKIDNLRLATASQNMCNKKARPDNRLGVKGVSICSTTGLYRPQLVFQGKRYDLGRYGTLEEAKEVWNTKARELHGEFFNPG